MSVIEVDQLTGEISAEAPGGADVEFDPAYFELEKLAQGTPESVMGDERLKTGGGGGLAGGENRGAGLV